ncbi:MAG: extracellular solute-binding protein [Anaerolineae bacterium]|nr:extracellular solute-binding protein [Anaerolineae bacterium]
MNRSSYTANRRRIPWLLVSLSVLLLLALAACAPGLLNPPRAGSEAAAVPPTEPPLNLRAPTPTGEPFVQSTAAPRTTGAQRTLTFWVEKPSPGYEQALQDLVNDFSTRHDVHVELVTIPSDLLPDLVTTAATTTSFALPDVVLAPLEYVAGWAEEGILDAEAATILLEELGPATFDQDALALVRSGSEVAAIPSDGWQQLLLYRSDWFEDNDLAPPTDFEAMLTAAEVISDRTNLIYSFNMPTESSLVATTRAFEQMAIANGCQLFNARGELQILEPVCRDALEFYRFLCNSYCPPGVQTEVSALNAFLSGRSGFILTSPWALPAIAGLDEDYRPTCPDCSRPGFLAANTGIVTTFSGRSEEASPENLGAVNYLAVTSDGDQEAAAAFVDYWFNDGYLQWLAIEPARKVPMRRGMPGEPERFVEAWYELPLVPGGESLAEVFGAEVATTLASDIVNRNRWAYEQGEGALITSVFEELTLSILLQELLSGYYDSDRAAIEGYKRLVELIPDYEYYFDPEPTPES